MESRDLLPNLPDSLKGVAREMEISDRRVQRAHQMASDSAYNHASDLHWEALARYNAMAKEVGWPPYHELLPFVK